MLWTSFPVHHPQLGEHADAVPSIALLVPYLDQVRFKAKIVPQENAMQSNLTAPCHLCKLKRGLYPFCIARTFDVKKAA